jgi:hypothetical protein
MQFFLKDIYLMEHTTAKISEDIAIAPGATSSAKDFDFLHGKWSIKNRKLRSRLNGCTDWDEFDASGECRSILNGFGNIDNFLTTIDGRAFEGMTLRLFDPSTRLWSIYWADSNAVQLQVPQVGSYDGDIGTFLARDTFEGKDIVVKFNWGKTDRDKPVWGQAFSDDAGATWEWNWYMYFSRV